MQKLQGGCQVLNDVAGLLLGKLDAVLDVIQKLTAVDLLEDEVEPLRLLEILDELDDIFVTLAVVKHFDLLEDPRPAVAGHLFDDLDGVLNVRVDVLAGPDGGVSALAQDLAGEVVELVEGGGHEGGVGLLLLPPSRLGFLLSLCKNLGGVRANDVR